MEAPRRGTVYYSFVHRKNDEMHAAPGIKSGLCNLGALDFGTFIDQRIYCCPNVCALHRRAIREYLTFNHVI